MSPIYNLSLYPKKVLLRDGTEVTLRPMKPGDRDALLQFFLQVTEDDRFYLKEDVTSPKVLQRWEQELDYDRALSLLAFVDSKVMADATLHRRRAGARRHTGELRAVVQPQYRNRSLGTCMLQELVQIAYDAGLEQLVMELASPGQDDAIAAAERLGFVRVATLEGFARDIRGKPQTLVFLQLPLGKWYEWWQF